MKIHLLALAVVGLISFFIGIFASVVFIRETVRESVFEAFDYYISEHGNEEIN